MLQDVVLSNRSLAGYVPIIGEKQADLLEEAARPLMGKRVLHISATPFGGGVAEMLHPLVPLMRAVGIDANWKVILGESEFFDVTKSFHNALQGGRLHLTKPMETVYLSLNKVCAESLQEDFDIVIVHDPQPLAIRHFYPTSKAKWICRCHIDTTAANKTIWSFLKPYIEEYDAHIFTLKEFVPQDIALPKVHLFQPAIDPLNLKNISLPPAQCKQIAISYGVDPKRPIIAQVSRFDIWKDPFGVIDVYRLVKEEFSQVQLVLIGSMASDDPEGWEYFCRVVNYAEGDENVHILANLGDIEVNAFQRIANVVIQKSVREAFGLVVSEALWKKRPVVAGRVGGIPLQVKDNKNGFLASKTEEYANKICKLLRNDTLAKKFGENGHKWVKDKFLITRLLSDYLTIIK